MKLTKNLGLLFLGIWLIVTGLSRFVNLPINDLGPLMSFLALAAGVLILLGR